MTETGKIIALCIFLALFVLAARDKLLEIVQVLAACFERLLLGDQTAETDDEAPEPADPCDTCRRWDECNGADRDTCPLWRAEKEE